MVIDMASGFNYDDFFIDRVNAFEFGAPNPDFDHKIDDVSIHLSSNGSATASSPLSLNGNATASSPLSPNGHATASSSSHEGGSSEDSEIFSDLELSFIGRMLMEEDIDEKLDMFQGHPSLAETEKPFYDILGEKYPSFPDETPLHSYNHSVYRNPYRRDSVGGGVVDSSSWAYNAVEEVPYPHNFSVPVVYSSHSSFGLTNSVDNAYGGLEEPLFASQFRRGVEEAQKFLPSSDKLVVDLEANGFSLPKQVKDEKNDLRVEVKVEKEDGEYLIHGSRGRKNPHSGDLDLVEGRSNKHSAVDYSEETLRSEMFDLVLLCDSEKCSDEASALRDVMQQNGASKPSQNGNSKGGGKGRGRRQSKTDTADLRTLLMHCSQAVAADDRRTSNELLKQIRQHSSPFGDGMQRLAQIFADGLEARLAGTGSDKYRSLLAKQVTATDSLKAYKLFMSACPFKRISHFFANQTILDVTEKASKIHILDFGIYYGFQWPCFIKRLSTRPGGPPELRITGIEIPQPGFRPAEKVEETGRRIAEYARSFNVPFKYHAIAAKWETIKVEDLKIEKDEVLVVNCLFRLKNMLDESVVVDSPRNMVLNTIRKLNPAIFIQAIVNGSYNAPFFVTRFREALFHHSAVFDMLEATVPRENGERMLIERTIFGRDAMNVIACEGTERVERPETYKQWQVRNNRAGFVQIPFDRHILNKSKEKVKECYHKDFVVDEDGRWILLGWKGRIIYGLSAWRPNSQAFLVPGA